MMYEIVVGAVVLAVVADLARGIASAFGHTIN
jgi:hypothetical protein